MEDPLQTILSIINSQDPNDASAINDLIEIMDAAKNKISEIAINTETEVAFVAGIEVHNYDGDDWLESSGDWTDHWSESSAYC